MKSTQIGYNGFDIGTRKGTERRHSSSSNAILNKVGDLCIGEPLHPGTVRDVRGSLSASAVEPVASSTARRESLLPSR